MPRRQKQSTLEREIEVCKESISNHEAQKIEQLARHKNEDSYYVKEQDRLIAFWKKQLAEKEIVN